MTSTDVGPTPETLRGKSFVGNDSKQSGTNYLERATKRSNAFSKRKMTVQVEKEPAARDFGLVPNDVLQLAEPPKNRVHFARSPDGARMTKQAREFFAREMHVIRRHTNFMPTRNLVLKKAGSNRKPFQSASNTSSQVELMISRTSPDSARNPLLLPALSPANLKLRDFNIRQAEKRASPSSRRKIAITNEQEQPPQYSEQSNSGLQSNH